MKRRTIITSFLGVLLTGGGLLMGGSSVGALTWQESVPVEFTFNPSLTVSLSSADLAINNLMPGNVSDSNAITVNVKSNWGGGYTLSSTVGSATLANDGGAIYNTNALIHSSYTSADNADIAGGTYTKPIFSSISGNVTAITADDTWGYSYSTDGGASWINAAGTAGYSKLPKYTETGATLKETKTTTAEAGDNVGFKIAAKAGTEQDGGEYRNVINFTVVGAPTPTATYMQDLDTATIAALLPETGDTITVKDSRDEKDYTIAKLADGKYWMVSDLNLAGGTTLNVGDSNVPSDGYYTLPASTAITSGTSVPSDQFSSDTGQYVFNTGRETTAQADCTSSQPCNSYYSWLVATAGGKDANGNAVTSNGYNTAYSICPKGWRLPTSTTSNGNAQQSNRWKTGDWYALATAYGANLESNYYQSAGTFYNNAGPGTTPNFLLSGFYNGGSFGSGGSYGYYWSATSGSSTLGYYLDFNSGVVSSADDDYRRRGFPVRCVFAQ